MSNRAVFLDRDNTVIEDPGYLADPGAVKLLPGVELAIKSLTQAGYKIVIVTNQSGIARGRLTIEMLEKIHAEMQRQLAERGAHVDGIQYCPYHPEGTVEEFSQDSELRKALEPAHYIASISKEILDAPRVRLGDTHSEGLNPKDALTAYLKTRDITEERAELLMNKAQELFDTVSTEETGL